MKTLTSAELSIALGRQIKREIKAIATRIAGANSDDPFADVATAGRKSADDTRLRQLNAAISSLKGALLQEDEMRRQHEASDRALAEAVRVACESVGVSIDSIAESLANEAPKSE